MAGAYGLEDPVRLRDIWNIEEDLLETPVKGGVGGHIHPVFVQSGRADNHQIPGRQIGFHHIGQTGVRASLTIGHDLVDFVRKQDISWIVRVMVPLGYPLT